MYLFRTNVYVYCETTVVKIVVICRLISDRYSQDQNVLPKNQFVIISCCLLKILNKKPLPSEAMYIIYYVYHIVYNALNVKVDRLNRLRIIFLNKVSTFGYQNVSSRYKYFNLY